MSTMNRNIIEAGHKKDFAPALDWPGWSRSGKSEEGAIRTLTRYADRYRKVIELARLDGIVDLANSPNVMESVQGSGATHLSVPDRIVQIEGAWMSSEECDRQIAIVRACRGYFDDTGGRVSEDGQKGPRGDGRNRSLIIDHTIGADRGYARQIGVKTPKDQIETSAGIVGNRNDVLNAIRQLNGDRTETKWPLRYFIRQVTWHLLDHAWEMDDRGPSGEEETR